MTLGINSNYIERNENLNLALFEKLSNPSTQNILSTISHTFRLSLSWRWKRWKLSDDSVLAVLCSRLALFHTQKLVIQSCAQPKEKAFHFKNVLTKFMLFMFILIDFFWEKLLCSANERDVGSQSSRILFSASGGLHHQHVQLQQDPDSFERTVLRWLGKGTYVCEKQQIILWMESKRKYHAEWKWEGLLAAFSKTSRTSSIAVQTNEMPRYTIYRCIYLARHHLEKQEILSLMNLNQKKCE